MAPFDPQEGLTDENFPETTDQLVAHVKAHAANYLALLKGHGNLLAVNNSQSNEIDHLKNQVAILRQQTQQNQQSTMTSADKLALEIAKITKNPDPERFNGEASALDHFTAQLRIKLQEIRESMDLNPAFTEQHKLTKLINYSYGFLKGKAAEAMHAYYINNVCTLPSIDAFFENLNIHFGDPMAKENAGRELHGLSQNNIPFPQYHARWLQLVSKAGRNVETEFEHFRYTISIELTIALRADPTAYDDYHRFVERCNRLDSQMRVDQGRQSRINKNTTTQVAQQRTFTPQFGGNQTQTSTSVFTRPQNNAPHSFFPPAPPPGGFRPKYTNNQGFGNSPRSNIPTPQFGRPAFGQNNFSRPQGERMQLDYAAAHPNYDPTTHNPDGSVSEAERARRRDGNLCNVCGESGHYKLNCPNSREARATRLNRVNAPSETTSSSYDYQSTPATSEYEPRFEGRNQGKA